MPKVRAWVEMVSTPHGNVKVLPSTSVGEHYPSFANLGELARRLKRVLDEAPAMVSAARLALFDALKTAKKEDEGVIFTPGGQGVAKYFNLAWKDDKKPQYINTLDVIDRVFGKIADGFASFELVLGYTTEWDIADGTRGWVKMKGEKRVVPMSTIRSMFGSEHGCVLAPKEETERERAGKIHLDAMLLAEAADDKGIIEAARVLIHEGSHKWARTHDVLYKHQTFSKMGMVSYFDNALDRTKLVPKLESMVMSPGKTNPKSHFHPMMGYEKLDQKSNKPYLQNLDVGNVILPERWLENADSYAWFARSMYKHYS